MLPLLSRTILLLALTLPLTSALHRPVLLSSPTRLFASISDSTTASTLFADALPFFADPVLLSEDVEYVGFDGRSIIGRAAYSSASSAWRDILPTRLRNFEITDKTVLPPDERGVVSCRYRISFDAPVPPVVLPGQRTRLAAANLIVEDGRTRVAAVVSGTVQLDPSRERVRRYRESLVADPFAVTTSIAHFEMLNARAIALDTRPALVSEPLAYWEAMRGMMRIEMDESVRRSCTDEMSVGGFDAPVSDEAFELAFLQYCARIFAIGFAAPAVAFGIANVLRAAVESTN